MEKNSSAPEKIEADFLTLKNLEISLGSSFCESEGKATNVTEKEEEEVDGAVGGSRENFPLGFTGALQVEENWKICPYNPSHRYLREFHHLLKCRQHYQKQLERTGGKMDIKICRYNWKHHVHTDQMEDHEESCEDAYTVYVYLVHHYIQKFYQRATAEMPPAMDDKKAEGDKDAENDADDELDVESGDEW